MVLKRVASSRPYLCWGEGWGRACPSGLSKGDLSKLAEHCTLGRNGCPVRPPPPQRTEAQAQLAMVATRPGRLSCPGGLQRRTCSGPALSQGPAWPAVFWTHQDTGEAWRPPAGTLTLFSAGTEEGLGAGAGSRETELSAQESGKCGSLWEPLSQPNLRESSLLGKGSQLLTVWPQRQRPGWGPPRIPQMTPLSSAPSFPPFSSPPSSLPLPSSPSLRPLPIGFGAHFPPGSSLSFRLLLTLTTVNSQQEGDRSKLVPEQQPGLSPRRPGRGGLGGLCRPLASAWEV